MINLKPKKIFSKIANKLLNTFYKVKAIVNAKNYSLKYTKIVLKGNNYFLPCNALHRPACSAFLSGKYYEPKTHEFIRNLMIKNPGNLIHAGSFFGDMIPSFSAVVGDGFFLYAFEPVLENYILAKKCIQENEITNTILMNTGLSSKFEVTKISTVTKQGKRNINLGGASTITEQGNQIINCISIDQLNLDNITCIQLDIEGYELNALIGAKKTIIKNLPVILIEDNKNNCSDFLNSLGYQKIKKLPGLSVWNYV